VARQPILDKKLKIFAYELLFRSENKGAAYDSPDGDKASVYTTVESFYSMGIESITNKKPAFINFTKMLLLEGVATLFPKDLLVIEVLEDVEPTEEVIEACRTLHEAGYVLALDDFVYKPELEPLIKMSRILKFDFIANTTREISETLKKIDVSGKILLAEKIETVEMFKKASKMGFTLFQGYFFCKPVTFSTRRLETLQITYLSLIKELGEGYDADFGKLANIIRNDMALCHKLLRMVNSVYYSLLSKVTDIKHALAILGLREIRKWVYVTSMMELCSKKPDELVRTSMIRAFFMEHVSYSCQLSFLRENLFLLGIFSLIDVIMEKPMELALNGMLLSPAITDALIFHKGMMNNFLMLAISIEKGDWDETDRLCLQFGITKEQISDAYIKAVQWCDSMLDMS